MKIKPESLLFIFLVTISLLVCGCSDNNTNYPKATPTPASGATPAPTATVTPTPSTPANSSAPAQNSTPTVTPVVSPTPTPNPYGQPGWPTYGVWQTLNMNPAPTGSIYGTLSYEVLPISITSFEVFATTDYVTFYNSSVDADGNYQIAGLSYGTYDVGYFVPGYMPYYYYEIDGSETLSDAQPDIEHDIFVMVPG